LELVPPLVLEPKLQLERHRAGTLRMQLKSQLPVLEQRQARKAERPMLMRQKGPKMRRKHLVVLRQCW